MRALVVAIGAAAALTLVIAIGAVSLQYGRDSGVRPSASPGANSPAPDRAAVAALLALQARAVRTHDRAAFLAVVDPAQPAFLARQGELFDSLRRLPLSGWRQEADTGYPATAGPLGATLRLTLRYRLAGFDGSDVVSTRYLTFARHPRTGWLITGDGSAQGLRDDAEIWDGGPLTVVKGRHSLVIGNSTTSSWLHEIARRLDQAVPIVTGTVGTHWARTAVALVPGDEQQVESLIGGGQSLREIAALATVTKDPGGAAHGQDRVIIAPDTFAKLNALGRHVVLTHELTHVATGGARDNRTPIWLIEGLADYVGYKGLKVSVRSAARELRTEVAAGRIPPGLPGRDDFAGASGGLSQAYELAWLACRMVAERYGEERLVKLYRAAGAKQAGASDPARQQEYALRTVLGLGTAAFTAQWRDYLREELA
ncbi:hypothetical protein ACRYCC_29360 [Actinomadura scrupuli]|uniref:hypothetical protein n=1 Tax=Actinomadura scrupuli TaxID=559629 RepID=UPI003D95308A